MVGFQTRHKDYALSLMPLPGGIRPAPSSHASSFLVCFRRQPRSRATEGSEDITEPTSAQLPLSRRQPNEIPREGGGPGASQGGRRCLSVSEFRLPTMHVPPDRRLTLPSSGLIAERQRSGAAQIGYKNESVVDFGYAVDLHRA